MSSQTFDARNSHLDTKHATKKKAAVLGTDKKKHFPLVAIILTCLLVAGVAGFTFLRWPRGEPPSTVASTDKVALPLESFQDGKVRYYQLKTEDGKVIKFFVLKSSDGVIRAAFDACDVCWTAGQGYYPDGDFMVCRNCRQRFASVKVNEVKGGCNPAPLKREIENGQVVLKVEDILEGRQYFDFPRRGRI
jgi:uncharacterized membrane protein